MMDPETTLAEMIEAFDADDLELAADRAADLLEWLDKGGFTPKFGTFGERGIVHVLCEVMARCEYLRLQLSLESDELTGGHGGHGG